MRSREVFDVIWKALEERGYVDAEGGCEYTRTREHWEQGDAVQLATEAAWKVVKHELRSHLWPLLEVVLAATVAIYAKANEPARDLPTQPAPFNEAEMTHLDSLLKNGVKRGN